MSTAATPVYEWKDLPWRKLEQGIFKLQKRIYQASTRGDVKTVHRLQRLLMKSWAARCLAVRRVSQDNQGKKTAGVDGVASLTPKQRLSLAQSLTPFRKARPVRRVWIPKPGKTEKRPLGIPVMRDRAAQTLVRLALEPEWEARFEPNSYGFRPGRSCHDAIEAIFGAIRLLPRYVLDADIAKCFDRIDHAALLRKLRTFPTLRRVIHGWLKAGVMDGKELFPTEAGTPQGGALSPLLANIALLGLETHVRAAFTRTKRINGVDRTNWKPIVVRYADDFVILHENLAIIEHAREIAAQWLAGMRLELKPEKTRISHTLVPYAGNIGFDFLGFEVRQYRVGYHRCGKGRLGFKTIIKPSKDAQKRHYTAMADIVRRHRTAPQEALVSRLNPIVRGWSRYHSTIVAKRAFSKLDHLLFRRLWRWARRRHPNKSRSWVAKRYWHSERRRTWVFGTSDGVKLVKHTDTPIRRHTKVKGTASLYDGNWPYWATRLGRHPQLPPRVATLLRWQKGKCNFCGLYFRVDDLAEVDHIIPRSQGGRDGYINWQLVHRHCHVEKTATDGSNRQWSDEAPVTKASH